MKTKVVLSKKAQKISTIAVASIAIAGVIGLGLSLTSDTNAATTKSTNASTKSPSSTTTKPATNATSGTGTTTPTTTTPATTTPAAATPNTGLFTGDDEFTQADGIIMVTGLLAILLTGYAVYHNRKTLFRGRVNFDKH